MPNGAPATGAPHTVAGPARGDRPLARLARRLPRDARTWQLVALGLLLGAGVALRDFSLQPAQVGLAFAAGIATQCACVRALGIPRAGLLSALITCLGVSLLLRSDTLWVHPLATTFAIGSKFVVRYRGKHVYNPGNLGIVIAGAVLPGAWVSAGQWGSDLLLAGWVIALGGLVTHRAGRAGVGPVFLGVYGALLLARALWLGLEAAVVFHQLASGALLLFTFFMISDPMTSPDHRGARMAWVAAVAAGAFVLQYGLHTGNALLWALFFAAPFVPLLDRRFPAPRFAWGDRARALPGVST